MKQSLKESLRRVVRLALLMVGIGLLIEAFDAGNSNYFFLWASLGALSLTYFIDMGEST